MNIENFFLHLAQIESKTRNCSFNNCHSTTEEASYCYQCNKWLCQLCIEDHNLMENTANHSIIPRELCLNTKCVSHKDEPATVHCNQCNLSICHLCEEQSHTGHSLISLNSIKKEIDLLLKDFALVEDIKKKNGTIKNELITLIDKEIEELNKFKFIIESTYERNETMNKMIHNLLLSFKSMYELLNNVPCYEAMANIKNSFNINKEEIRNSSSDKMLKSNCLNAINYWNSHYVIEFKSDIRCISTIETSNDKTLCMLQLKDQRLVTGTSNKAIKIWSIEKLKCLNSFQGHQDKVFSLTQLHDDRLLSGSVKEIKCWNSVDWSCLVTITGHSNAIFAIIQLKDHRFASASADKTIKLWDSITYKCHHSFNEHECTVYCLCELKGGMIVSGSRDKSIRLWDVQLLRSKAWLKGHTDNVNCLFQLKDGKLASGSSDNTIRIWDINTCLLEKTIGSSRYIILSLLQLNDGSLVSGAYKQIVKWQINSNESKVFTGHSGAIRGLIELKDQRIASFSDDQTIKLWEI